MGQEGILDSIFLWELCEFSRQSSRMIWCLIRMFVELIGNSWEFQAKDDRRCSRFVDPHNFCLKKSTLENGPWNVGITADSCRDWFTKNAKGLRVQETTGWTNLCRRWQGSLLIIWHAIVKYLPLIVVSQSGECAAFRILWGPLQWVLIPSSKPLTIN